MMIVVEFVHLVDVGVGYGTRSVVDADLGSSFLWGKMRIKLFKN